MNNQEAFVQVGATVPFIIGTTTTTFGITNQTDFRDVGLILRVSYGSWWLLFLP